MGSIADERTTLLPTSPRTPLPKFQLAIIMLVQVCEPLASQSIYPYINQLVSELDITGGDEKKVGYYAGLESLFFLTEALTVLQWSRASDRVGRKPILLLGLIGTCVSMLLFGLSRTFWALVASRCLTGLLNGNIGVMKSAMGDMTDPSNRAEGFAYIPVVWDVGAALGPLVGGFLACPHEHFPRWFSATFWREFPYFLPCLATGGFVLMTCFVVLVFFEEPIHLKKGKAAVSSGAPTRSLSPQRSGPLPLRALLTFPVLISIANYVGVAFLYITLSALLPLFLAMPIPIGGIGLPPAKIGLVLSAYSAATALFQVFFCARLIGRFGATRVFIGGISTSLLIFALFPVMSVIAKREGVTPVVWVLIACVLALGALLDTAFAAVFMFLTVAAPASSRGMVNGLAQTAVSAAKAFGPALATSLFSLSVEKNLLNGYAVYAVLMGISLLALVLGNQLPAEVWEEVDQ
ncbi:major facilitator superfamily domain-containing protein [Mycena alexandri]|uniref:Major facilitator superfamily domain-containing protein n=1 Tax=Mycena alexandri TaxID=1745969 RepID=A0AAD6SGC1_9AGAR|nr:major facilitator superfamily domain-containing protein [Mycena alexandri]